MNTTRILKKLAVAAALLLALVLTSTSAFADKVVLKDGTVVEGKIKRNDAVAVVITVTVNGKEEDKIFSPDEVSKTVIEEAKPAAAAPEAAKKPEAAAPAKTEAKKDEVKKGEKAAKQITGRPTRVAILNFGPPRSWQGEVESTVGIEIAADAWRRAVPLLEKDNVDVVVVRINSGGGMLLELARFHEVYQRLYKPRFRTVAWVESAISCAAMSPWVIEEFYMLPEGNIGACTGWSGALVAMKGMELEVVIRDMEEASRLGGRDPKIMRSMQIQEPLSCNIDEDGNVTWFQDLSGKHTVNPANQILTFNANDAVKFKFAKAIAATPEELMKAMGITEYVWAGKEAVDYIDNSMRTNDRTNKRLREVDAKYVLALNAARQLRGDQNKDLRMQEIGKARAALRQMAQWMSSNSNFALMYGRDRAWFDEQERILKELSKDDRR